ncbi:hypothetical protein TWF718_006053 [Orbilia javanica]|uniref:H-type lectin domain-containing protein n=1 Tax=Orbilia javanica TaxID=47235 RepID=A0AAN8MST1_9PEZI
MTSLSSRNLYTIGWICALPLERTAAISMLDEEHRRPRDFEQSRSDTNSYAWGNIGAHNVVIASLPVGEYGLASAAGAAISLLLSFPEVRFGLMVGIGAGIPGRSADVRLGDVVVSRPQGRSGGVVQYDFVKAIQGGVLQRMGALDSPPRVLLNAVAAMQAQHARQPSHIPRFLNEMITRNPIMAQPQQGLPGYTYQGSSNDRLFVATYPHSQGDSCDTCDPTQQVQRTTRNSTDPQIHYGLIASGNTLIKDAAARSTLVSQTGEDCICFEMEAAGLMNQFPCLVIRGICDYADAHKNDRWQRYAAATASAYAKELFEYIPVQGVSTASGMEALERSSQRIALDVVNVGDIRDDSSWTKRTDGTLQCWERRVGFEQEFTEPPMVITALRAIGAAPSRQRSVGWANVDRSGFTIRFWAESDHGIGNMSASWFAVGR